MGIDWDAAASRGPARSESGLCVKGEGSMAQATCFPGSLTAGLRLMRSTDQFTSGRSSSQRTPVMASMSGQASAGTRSLFQRETEAFDVGLPRSVSSCARRDEPLAASQARTSADFSVVSDMVAEYDISELRLPQPIPCNERRRSYAARMNKTTGKAKAVKTPKATAAPEKDPFAVAFGNRLKRAREALFPPMTQEALGEQIGAKKPNISQWENGTHMPDFKTLDALCNVLQCSADRLLGRAEERFSAEALVEAHAFDKLPPEQQQKWRAMRLALFAQAVKA